MGTSESYNQFSHSDQCFEPRMAISRVGCTLVGNNFITWSGETDVRHCKWKKY